MSVKDILKLAEFFEIEGYKFYRSKKEELKSKLIKDVFSYLQEMEKEHTEYIRKLLKTFESSEKLPTNIFENTDENFFLNRFKSQKLDNVPYEDDIKDLSILRMAFLIEKDFVSYYNKAAESAEKINQLELREILIHLRNWEEGHANLIENLIKEIYTRKSLDLGFYPFER
ncbi:ferritin family protein [Thermosipho ferrireducens]|uniref:Ferritin family protein n=1 Tax=Thermosipho ferrireducens TaxID=2571116 RepID=A0ABX7S662_9BACT|nr:ferritin family protein [Thermosipho ferrireducens]QTA38064.1 ferritin family protein [Thermosipho ferrireducens]